MSAETEAIIATMRFLAEDLLADDGVASKAIADAADMMEDMAGISMAARPYVEAYKSYQRAVRRRSKNAAECNRYMKAMHRALVEAVDREGAKW